MTTGPWLTFVSGRPAFDTIMGYIQNAKESGAEILFGGSGTLEWSKPSNLSDLVNSEGDDSTGYFIQPTLILTKDPKSVTMVDEIFGPVVTVRNRDANPPCCYR